METEHELLKNLSNRKHESTTFIIAHRISAVKNADLIIANGVRKIGDKKHPIFKNIRWHKDATTLAPYVAIGFRAAKINGVYRYMWLQKVQFKIPNESFETKGTEISFKTPEIEGTFMKAKVNDSWKADYTGLPTTEVASSWFTNVKHEETVSA